MKRLQFVKFYIYVYRRDVSNPDKSLRKERFTLIMKKKNG